MRCLIECESYIGRITARGVIKKCVYGLFSFIFRMVMFRTERFKLWSKHLNIWLYSVLYYLGTKK